MTQFHAEVQKVFYWTYEIEADDQDAAWERADAKVSGGVVAGHPERARRVVGRKLVSRLVTNVHPVTDTCVVRGCAQHFADALDELADDQ